MNFPLDRIARVFASVALLAACRGEDPIGGEGSTSQPLTTTGDEDTAQLPTTSAGDTTGVVDPSSTSGDPQTSTTDNTNAFITTNSTTDDPTNTGPQPNGASCMDDAECESTHCYSPPIAMGMGVCSECETDQDCMDAGTGISCTADLLSMQATCTAGGLGNNCMSDAACMEGLTCETAIDLMGLFPDSCSECAESTDCTNDQLCSPVVDMGMFSAYNTCVDPGSVANGNPCPDDEADGDAACMSGHCADADVFGFFTLPVCGECETDADCDMGETCTAGSVSMNGITGSTCG